MKTPTVILATALGALLALGCAGDEPTSPEASEESLAAHAVGHEIAKKSHRYEVTIENLTRPQPFSPGVLVTHSRHRKPFHPGKRAPEGLRLIAENGDPSVAEVEFSDAPGVHEVVVVPQPTGCVGCNSPFPSEQSLTIEATVKARRLSLAIMLICTNDGYVGLHGVRLPYDHRSVTYYAKAYDAGTEANDERYTSIVDACGAIGPVAVEADGLNERTATANVVRRHKGIAGTGDLDPAVYDWSLPVAKITIRRIKD